MKLPGWKWLTVIVGVLALLLFIVPTIISVSNTEISLRKRILAQQENLEVVFDNTWKTINQVAQVPSQYKEDFRSVYSDIMGARYANERGGALFSWIREHNPQFDPSLYTKVQTVIEAERANFTREQKKLVDLHREHSTYISVFPNSLIVGRRGEVQIQTVTSQKTEETFRSGQENDMKVFEQ